VEHNLWLAPVNVWVMFSEPGISEDNIIMSQVRDVKGDNFMVFIGLHGEKNFVSLFCH